MSRPKSSQKHEDILRSANSLFLKHGFNDVSMDKIREKANVSKNTLYSHFKDKNALFKAVILDHWENEKTPKISVQPGEPTATTLQKFAKSLLKHLYTAKTRSLFRILIAEAERFPDLSQSIISNNQPPILLNVSQFLENAYNLEQIKAKREALYFFGLLKEDAFWHVLAGFRKPYTNNEIESHVNDVVAIFTTMLEKNLMSNR